MTLCETHSRGHLFECGKCDGKQWHSPELANERASVLLNGRDYPHVVEHIEELREERERRYGVTTIGPLRAAASIVSRCRRGRTIFSSHQRRKKSGQLWSGLTIDRRENINTVDQMTRDQIVARLDALRKTIPTSIPTRGQNTRILHQMRPRDQRRTFWNTIGQNLPKKCFATRIENKHGGGGVLDIHMIWDRHTFMDRTKNSEKQRR